MSIMTTELIERLRQHADTFAKSGFAVDGLVKDYREAANTIQILSEKLHVSQMEQKWIPISERLPETNEEAYSDTVIVTLNRTWYDPIKGRIRIIKLANYDKNAISSDGKYMDTEGWILQDGETLSMNEVLAWMPLPEKYQPYEDE